MILQPNKWQKLGTHLAQGLRDCRHCGPLIGKLDFEKLARWTTFCTFPIWAKMKWIACKNLSLFFVRQSGLRPKPKSLEGLLGINKLNPSKPKLPNKYCLFVLNRNGFDSNRIQTRPTWTKFKSLTSASWSSSAHLIGDEFIGD